MEREIYQKQYDFELEQRNSIASAANVPIVALTVVGGALSTMIVDFKYSWCISTYTFTSLSVLSLIAIVFSLVFIFRSFLGYTYQKIPTSSALAQYEKELKEWHTQNSGNHEDSIRLAKIDFDEYFENKLSEAVENNGANNLKRGNFLHNATLSVAIALAFLVLAAPFYIYQKINREDTIHQVEIVKPLKLAEERLNMSNENGNSGSSTTQQAAPANTPTAAPVSTKPPGPPNVMFKGSITFDSVSAAGNRNVATVIPPVKKGSGKE
ncbi:hypothetical protein [Methylobacter tundripaludum]|uniref:hypothetical protein n=1 Tax=Methylobacter tundripaludum TaxID=173365 RepID=UPI0004DF814C|nr:hypothetical protein [Methylobacter tundripaludum]